MLKKIHEQNVIDDLLFKAQRQGWISFYMSAWGEEASILGLGWGLDFGDTVFSQYWEQLIFYDRGCSLDSLIASCVGNHKCKNKGWQMPIHYTSKEHNFFSISSPLAT